MLTETQQGSSELAELVEEGRVHRRVYTDPAVFAEEMTRIFERTWLFVGHESEVHAPGDYKTMSLGRQPAIMVRHEDGQVYVLLNRCMHRGSVVCREERGNSSFFRCIYHGWTYNNRGELIGVPYRGGYGDGFDEAAFALLRPPRTASYRGFVFASLNPSVESLEQYLGKARYYIDLCLDRAPDGAIEVRSGVQKYSYTGNWKFQLENWLDGYHPNFTHQTAFDIRRRRTGARPGSFEGSAARTRGLPRGHGVLDYSGTRTGYQMGVAREHPEYMARLEARVGPEHAREVMERDTQLLVFPNLFLQEDRQHFRVVRPMAVDRTEVYAYPYTLKGAPDAANDRMVQSLAWWASAAGFGQPDDLDAFERCQQGLQVTAAEWVTFTRGLQREEHLPDGEIVGDCTDEVPQRGIFREWKRLMSTDPER
jgi:benzoate/toluate 1,2-dioxygenase subunit alpha